MLTDKDIDKFILIMIFFMILFQIYLILLLNQKNGVYNTGTEETLKIQ